MPTQLILLAKQLDNLDKSIGLESVDSEMQSPAYQNEEVRHLAAAASLVWLAEEHVPKSMAALFVGKASSADFAATTATTATITTTTITTTTTTNSIQFNSILCLFTC
jgi:hypothetical protein